MEPITAIAAASLLGIYLDRVVSRAGEATADLLSRGAVEALRRLHSAVKTRLSSDPSSAQALSQLEQQPRNDRRQENLVVALREISAEDPAFANELTRLVSEIEEAAPEIRIDDSGAVSLHGSVTVRGKYAAGRDISLGDHREPND